MSTGSEEEPTAPDAAELMRDATARLRDKAWMVSPMTSPIPDQPDRIDADAEDQT